MGSFCSTCLPGECSAERLLCSRTLLLVLFALAVPLLFYHHDPVLKKLPVAAQRHSSRFETPILHGSHYANITAGVPWLSLQPRLPSWKEGVRGLPVCTSEAGWDAPYAQPGTRGRLLRDTAGEIWYEPPGCRLHRPTAAEARSCLANKTILILGDSVVRYGYLELAYFLTHGRHMQRYADGGPEASVDCTSAHGGPYSRADCCAHC